jgi:hypothetical protein
LIFACGAWNWSLKVYVRKNLSTSSLTYIRNALVILLKENGIACVLTTKIKGIKYGYTL